jgi:hypothetical protein
MKIVSYSNGYDIRRLPARGTNTIPQRKPRSKRRTAASRIARVLPAGQDLSAVELEQIERGERPFLVVFTGMQ